MSVQSVCLCYLMATYYPFSAVSWYQVGNPLSPYLFLFTIQILSYLQSSAHEQELLKGKKVANSAPALLDVLFADDTLLFTRVKRHELDTLSSIL